jgi:hypothetical protein
MRRQITRLEVVAAGEKWNVQEQGIGRLSTHPTKVAATQAARGIAVQHSPCHIIIRNADGTVDSEDSYA